MPILGQTPASSAAAQADVETPMRTHRRFDRAARLIGEPALHRLMTSRVVIFGMGGVGSFAAEALSRNAVGDLVLVDFDDVCVTNTNRQLHAMKGNIGKRKVDIMAERCAMIHPTGTVTPVAKFYNAENSEELLDGKIDFVVDAIDNMTAKAHLLATCVARKIPVVSSMGAAARLDPTRVRTADISETEKDPFARSLRNLLREKHNIDCRKEAGPVGITAVFSDETPIAPAPISYDAETGFVCVCPNNNNGMHTCEKRSRIDGSAAFVTGTFGLVCASVVVRKLSAQQE
ncbi:MAG: tRNA threonylcarbamoyladenosine dehydratase [Sandaracinaceae bacterium]|nr:tRNA threonylcarbamoyladenosine dehydratase [Sandaracinaceae bacterium]